MFFRTPALRVAATARFTSQVTKTVRTQTRFYASASHDAPTTTRRGNEILLTVGVGSLAGATWYYYEKQSKAKETSYTATPTKTLDGENFMKFKLLETEDITYNTKKFRFELPSPSHILGLDIASAIVTRYVKPKTENQEKPEQVVRAYTPTSDEDARGYFDLVIKHYKDGPMSTHIHSLKPGDELEVKGPIPKYRYEKGKLTHIGMIAGGTGLTPMLQLLRKIFKDPTDETKVDLIFANVTEDDILLRSELEQMQNDHPDQLRVIYTLDKPPKGWTGEKGFVSANMVQKYLPTPTEEKAMIFVCGPTGMVAHVSGPKAKDFSQGELGGILAKLGYKKESVYKF